MINEPIGNPDAICPHCDQHLDKMPGRKKKCPHCGQFMFVRTRPGDGQRVLVTQDQAEQIEEQWSITNGTHAEYLANRQRFADEKARLAERFGKEPSNNDVTWSLLNQDMMKYAAQNQWGLFRNAKFEMAEILRKEARIDNALETYLEVCYLDLNGPSNMGGIDDPQLLKEFPPWDPKHLGELAPGIVDRVAKIIKKTGASQNDLEIMFFSRATKLSNSLHLPVAPSRAWRRIKEALF